MCSVGISISGALYAQDIPGSLDPVRPIQDLTPPLEPLSVPTPSIPLMLEDNAPEDVAQVGFVLVEVRLEGAQMLASEDLQDIWSEQLGQRINVGTLFEFVNAITRRYAERGYALSLAVLPEQTIDDGIVRIRIVEGYVEEVYFVSESGSDVAGHSPYLERYAQSILNSVPLRIADLERFLLLMNDLPGISATATFSASEDSQGASIMTVGVSKRSLEVQLGINNHLSRNLGRTRAGGTVNVNGLLTEGGRLRLDAWQGVENPDYVYVGVNYSQTLGAQGLRVEIAGAASNSEPDDGILSSLAYQGKHAFASLDVRYPFVRSRQHNFSVGGALAVSNADSDLLSADFTQDHSRTLSVYTVYDFAQESGAVNLVRLGLNQGLNIFDSTKDDDPLRSRASGSAEFTNLELTALRNQPLPGRFSAYLQVQGQAALGNPLLSAAECTYGGRVMGRGYDIGAISGDHCVMGAAELRWTHAYLNGIGLQAYGFADIGLVEQKGDLQKGEDRERAASSYGLGLRGRLKDWLELNLEVGVPVDAEYTDRGSDSAQFYFSANMRF